MLRSAHRLTATVWPLAITTLYTSAEAPLPITSSRRMSPARHSTADASAGNGYSQRGDERQRVG